MEHLLLLYFKDKPALLQAYHRLRSVLANVIILCSICISILAKNEGLRSFSLGLAAGIVLINIGQSINSIRNTDNPDKQLNG